MVTVTLDDCAQELEGDSCTDVAQRTLWKRQNGDVGESSIKKGEFSEG